MNHRRMNAAIAYVEALTLRGLLLGMRGDHLVIPPGHTPAEVEMVRLLKPELLTLLNTRSFFGMSMLHPGGRRRHISSRGAGRHSGV